MHHVRAIALLLPFLLASVGHAENAPVPPCGVPPEPPYSGVVSAPQVAIWHASDLSAVDLPQACTGWSPSNATLLLALSGSFRFGGAADDLLAAFGAISTLKGVQYWSVTDQHWRTLITDASALSGPDSAQRRPDFTIAEMRQGADLFFSQSDSRSSGAVVYRMRVREATPARVVISIENVTSVRVLVFPIYGPNDLKTTYFLTRISAGVWGYYDLTGIHDGVLGLFGGHDASYVNRAAAQYRHVAGVPTDQEPPAARD